MHLKSFWEWKLSVFLLWSQNECEVKMNLPNLSLVEYDPCLFKYCNIWYNLVNLIVNQRNRKRSNNCNYSSIQESYHNKQLLKASC